MQNEIEKLSGSASSSIVLNSSQANQIISPKPIVNPADVAKFLKLVAEGEEDQAEAMLTANKDLAQGSGDVTDLSKRDFKNITGFQYAVWALDWRMWTMIQKYLPEEDAYQQIKAAEQGSWVVTHKTDARELIQNLETALLKCINLYGNLKLAEGDRVLVKEVGGLQSRLPANMVNEYCSPVNSFNPCPNFTVVGALPRSRKTDEGEWFTCQPDGDILGEKFAYCRGHSAQAVAWQAGWVPPVNMLHPDAVSVRALLNARTSQHDKLITDLTKNHTQKLGASFK